MILVEKCVMVNYTPSLFVDIAMGPTTLYIESMLEDTGDVYYMLQYICSQCTY